jgi:hypothetical protein
MEHKLEDGTCQICGRRQRLVGGRLAEHGYRVLSWWGKTQGCFGSRHLPYEIDHAVLDSTINIMPEKIMEIIGELNQMETSPETTTVEIPVKTRDKEELIPFNQMSEYQWGRIIYQWDYTIRGALQELERLVQFRENWKPMDLEKLAQERALEYERHAAEKAARKAALSQVGAEWIQMIYLRNKPIVLDSPPRTMGAQSTKRTLDKLVDQGYLNVEAANGKATYTIKRLPDATRLAPKLPSKTQQAVWDSINNGTYHYDKMAKRYQNTANEQIPHWYRQGFLINKDVQNPIPHEIFQGLPGANF